MPIHAAVMDRKTFDKVYTRSEARSGVIVTPIDLDRAWNRYSKIVLPDNSVKGKD